MAAPTLPNVMDLNHGPGQPLAMDSFDQDLGFDESLLDGSALVPLPFAPTTYDFDPFASTFEDPFSYSARPFEPVPSQDLANDESSPQELDNKLLGFSEPIVHASLVDDAGKFVDVHMSAELYGMFFVAEDVFGGETTGRPFELTCYRRNLWQCSGQVTLARLVSHVLDDQGHRIPIDDVSASITAIESIEGKPTEIISIPWKNANPPLPDEARVAAAPPSLALDLSAGTDVDEARVSLPVSWKRLQFKHATANNGRRKGLQQHYVVQINLLGKAKTGETVKIAEIQSGPVIVRGRSPRNFDSRRDVPLIGDKKMAADRKLLGSSDGALIPGVIKAERDTGTSTGSGSGSGARHDHAQRYHHQAAAADLPCASDWPTPTPQPQSQPLAPSHPSPHPAKRVATSPAFARPPIPAWSSDSVAAAAAAAKAGQVPRTLSLKQTAGVPISLSLSLSEDDKSSGRSSAELQSPQLSKAHPTNGLTAASSNSPAEEADPLYEYFPLSVDDWMPPVDAVYRPHIVHHTIVPAEFKAQGRSRSKRYFAAD